MGSRRPILVTANSAWNIVNFRAGLVRALAANGYAPVLAVPPDAEASARMAELGFPQIAVEIDRSGLDPRADLKLIHAYRRIIGQVKPLALLGFTIKPNIYGCIAARLRGVPAIPNISGLGTVFVAGGWLQGLVTRMYRFALKGAPVVFFQNREDLELFVGQGIIRREQARRLPGSGVDLERFTPSPLPAGPPAFLLVARLLSDKGIREYVEAARQVREQWPEARFRLLGPIDDGNPTAISRRELDGWVRDGAVEYLGETEDVRPFIAAASVLVLPSYYREGVPRTLLEGAAMGRPLTTTDFPGCRDALCEGVNGFLCQPRSAEALAAAIIRALQIGEGGLAELGRASRRLAEERFDERLVIQAYLDALAGLRPRS